MWPVAAILDTAALVHSDLHGQPRGIQVQSSHSHLWQGRPPPNLARILMSPTYLAVGWISLLKEVKSSPLFPRQWKSRELLHWNLLSMDHAAMWPHGICGSHLCGGRAISFCRWENWGFNRWNNLFNITELDRAGWMGTQVWTIPPHHAASLNENFSLPTCTPKISASLSTPSGVQETSKKWPVSPRYSRIWVPRSTSPEGCAAQRIHWDTSALPCPPP